MRSMTGVMIPTPRACRDWGNVLLFFPNGSFVQVLDAADAPVVLAPEAGPGTGRYLDGAPLDHFSLFAADVAALEQRRRDGIRLNRNGSHCAAVVLARAPHH